MSYEGYEQAICENGHLSSFDHWEDSFECPDCGSTVMAWENSVDETNCDSFGFIDMDEFLLQPAKWGWRFVWRKMTKGFVKVEKRPAVYRIPTEEETRAARMYRNESGKLVHFVERA